MDSTGIFVHKNRIPKQIFTKYDGDLALIVRSITNGSSIFSQLKQQIGIDNPGFPFPIIGHSFHFLGVDPKDILQKFQYFFEKSETKRKVNSENIIMAYK